MTQWALSDSERHNAYLQAHSQVSGGRGQSQQAQSANWKHAPSHPMTTSHQLQPGMFWVLCSVGSAAHSRPGESADAQGGLLAPGDMDPPLAPSISSFTRLERLLAQGLLTWRVPGKET